MYGAFPRKYVMQKVSETLSVLVTYMYMKFTILNSSNAIISKYPLQIFFYTKKKIVKKLHGEI